ncbi:hypothetical protein [Mesorhizobium sp. A623]
MTTITNIEAIFNNDYNIPVIAFDHDGASTFECLDDDGTLCAAHASNMHNYLDVNTANEVRERLREWLSSKATISVAVNGEKDFFVFEVAADADEADIAEAIEAESNDIGGSDSKPVFFDWNSVRVYRNGFEIDDLRKDETSRAA